MSFHGNRNHNSLTDPPTNNLVQQLGKFRQENANRTSTCGSFSKHRQSLSQRQEKLIFVMISFLSKPLFNQIILLFAANYLISFPRRTSRNRYEFNYLVQMFGSPVRVRVTCNQKLCIYRDAITITETNHNRANREAIQTHLCVFQAKRSAIKMIIRKLYSG